MAQTEDKVGATSVKLQSSHSQRKHSSSLTTSIM